MAAENSGSVDRRSILKGLGAASAGATATTGVVGATGSGAGAESFSTLRTRYQNPESVKKAVREHAGDLLEELSERGLVSQPSVSALDLDTKVQPSSFRNEDDNASIASVESDTEGYTTMVAPEDEDAGAARSALIAISKNTSAHRLAVYVQPENDKSYAIIKPRGEGDRYMLNTEYDSVKVQKKNCPTKETCGSTCGSCPPNGRSSARMGYTKDCYYIPELYRCECTTVASGCSLHGCSCSSPKCGGCCDGSKDCDDDGGIWG